LLTGHPLIVNGITGVNQEQAASQGNPLQCKQIEKRTSQSETIALQLKTHSVPLEKIAFQSHIQEVSPMIIIPIFIPKYITFYEIVKEELAA
jgi:hypothetical protein